MIPIFIGYDPRFPIATSVCMQSILDNSSIPVALTPLNLATIPLKRRGLTEFTFSRFMIPYLLEYSGWALFMDSDVIVTGDIAEIFRHCDNKYAIRIVKNKLRFEWASVMLMNCDKLRMLTPDVIETAEKLHTLDFIQERLIGELPAEWNVLVGYDEHPAPKLLHYTQGNPCYEETAQSPHAEIWNKTYEKMNFSISWQDFMGKSIHAAQVGPLALPRFLFDETKTPVEPKPQHADFVRAFIKKHQAPVNKTSGLASFA